MSSNGDTELLDESQSELTLAGSQENKAKFEFFANSRIYWKQLLFFPLLIGATGYACTFLVSPTFTARTSFLPPLQQQSAAGNAMLALGTLGALAGGASGIRSPADQFIALLHSETVANRLIDKFQLQQVYDEKLRQDARKKLREYSAIAAGKRDGLITIEVEDTDPHRAADVANQYIEELRLLTSTLAVSEAQQRRAFFQSHLEKTRDALTKAQQSVQASGFDGAALRAEPKAAAEQFARLKAEVTSAEVRVQTLRASLTDQAPEIQAAQTTLRALRNQLIQLEGTGANPPTRAGTAGNAAGSEYLGRFREFKYQETLFDLYARQFELARLDESREGALIQVIDKAVPAERQTRPKRKLLAAIGAAVTLIFLLIFIFAKTIFGRSK